MKRPRIYDDLASRLLALIHRDLAAKRIAKVKGEFEERVNAAVSEYLKREEERRDYSV